MSKWADFGISAVRFNATHTHIDKVRAHSDNGDLIGVSSENSRQEVVAAIKQGISFITIFKRDANKWDKGQPVRIIAINGQEYLKTVENKTEVDNLDNLPEF